MHNGQVSALWSMGPCMSVRRMLSKPDHAHDPCDNMHRRCQRRVGSRNAERCNQAFLLLVTLNDRDSARVHLATAIRSDTQRGGTQG
jgi:hypothetical protein